MTSQINKTKKEVETVSHLALMSRTTKDGGDVQINLLNTSVAFT